LDDLIDQLPGRFGERIAQWRNHPRVLALRDDARIRLSPLGAIAPGSGCVRAMPPKKLPCAWPTGWSRLLRRESYLALLLERPAVHERLLRMLGAAKWPARYLLKHPGVIDELAGDTMLSERFVAADFEREIEAALPGIADYRRGRRRRTA
jgi:glutamate-ammonia-ligase adenylyltransferase